MKPEEGKFRHYGQVEAKAGAVGWYWHKFFLFFLTEKCY